MSNVYTVSQVNNYIKNMFTQDFMLNRIAVQGEVSNCKYHSSGHLYFSLKDGGGAIACVMFAGQRKGLAFSMKNGDRVVVNGSVSVYERDGRYQLYAREIRLEGEGALYEQFLALKRQLEEMGMFAPEYKRPIPAYIRRLGVVTAPTGAAIQDIRNIAGRRNPYVQVILYPALVQGEGAASSIVRGIEALDELGVDVIIVGRGGGSMEDLWAFNEEPVARAIFQCRTPVISAVGHETDVTIADFAADLRAPTPSAAAELAVFDIREFQDKLDTIGARLQTQMSGRISRARQMAEGYRRTLGYLSPENQIREKRMYLMTAEEKLSRQMELLLQKKRHALQLYIERMKGLSPLEKLNQGFAYVEKDGRAVKETGQVKEQDLLTVHVSDGRIWARVEKTEKGGNSDGKREDKCGGGLRTAG
ncbi:MAG TPA: exodeoxyribonuclease VII large subunit [Candidatus Pullilachnospira stercoravium]|uniref:Exodeoxyribonuclease 7 large subunit n=1 Tax=Candidatus Pullilachnospira stercoravium TaxID=2840913 RepID=A0A9D1NVX7_9FIRM|nr:exodeoxyribonuclease VII large subunit [Candidatus Pullilachnospira stercoravium]